MRGGYAEAYQPLVPGPPLNGPTDVGRDPTAIEPAGLWRDPLAADEAGIHRRGMDILHLMRI